MKKSITVLGFALLAFGTVNATNSTPKSNEFQSSIFFNHVGENTLRFVSAADPSLLDSELGSLKKHSKAIEETIADDAKTIEAVPVAVTPKVKEEKKNPVQLKKNFKN